MLLSVVVPNLNHGRYLPEALDAILSQTRPADEIIIIDDGSVDGSAEIIRRYASEHPTIRSVFNGRNMGAIRCMNMGLGIAQGDFIHFAAADDIVSNELYSDALDVLQRNPTAGLFSARCVILADSGRTITVMKSGLPLFKTGFVPPVQVAAELVRDGGWFTGGSTVWARSLLKDIGGFDEDLGSFCDGYAALALSLQRGACFSPKVLYGWRRATDGFAATTSAEECRVEELISVASRKFESTKGIFPQGFVRIWADRERFGARRFRLSQNRRTARSRGIVAALAASFVEVVGTVWLLIKLRRRDSLAIVRRRLKIAFYENVYKPACEGHSVCLGNARANGLGR